ncbi:MAG: hypothetical protein LBJ08_06670 [Bifidobacteriaceae bacterium]|nr:hypothetical protein [Bifidobacteriaceae bacterium]
MASFPDRKFQTWQFTVSLGSLLVRSPRGSDGQFNVDIMFRGVRYMALPLLFPRGLEVSRGDASDYAVVAAAVGDVVEPQKVFALVSDGRRYLVDAVVCVVDENDLEFSESRLVWGDWGSAVKVEP